MENVILSEKRMEAQHIGSIFLITVSACEALTSLALMQITQNIMDFDLNGFFKWLVIDLGIFVLMISFDQIGTVCKARVIRKMPAS